MEESSQNEEMNNNDGMYLNDVVMEKEIMEKKLKFN
jgi:hypothetical protein